MRLRTWGVAALLLGWALSLWRPRCLIPRLRCGTAAALAARPLAPITVNMRRAIASLKDVGASRDVYYDVVDPELSSREEQVGYFNAVGANNNGWQLEPEIGARLLSSLQLTPDDVLMDLGCSTGAFVLLSALLSPARKVIGVELSPSRHAEAEAALERLAVRRPEVAAKVQFLQGDFNARSDAKISQAVQSTTVAYYACNSLADFNLSTGEATCRPVDDAPVVAALTPGTRFVSLSVLAPEFEMWNQVELEGAIDMERAYSVKKKRCRLALEYRILGRL
ncbi:unnamed protein product [Symbiodinium natans]|uniref:DOT1 domain-containing protein n=1 Tax=Symbiodinium natans TaxID=878477 RepID=A0A812UJ71_9DINO|nr:unnamed protein product [Symbiodinium natans]